MSTRITNLTCQPLTPERWTDFEYLFGPRGACGGCWCMWWKLTNADMEHMKGDGNRQAQKSFVKAGNVPGILLYQGSIPIGWCAVEPRENYQRLERSRVLKPVDDMKVWSITCFFVAKDFRHQGVTVHLLRAAIGHVSRQGGIILEGYPTNAITKTVPGAFVYTGLASAFRKSGFTEIARRSKSRPIFRYQITAQATGWTEDKTSL